MKPLLFTVGLVLCLMVFTVFVPDHNSYLRAQEELKRAAEDAANAAALYYDYDAYGNGVKIYNKSEGNQVIAAVIDKTLRGKGLYQELDYTVYYIDGDKQFYEYHIDQFVKKEQFSSFPYQFEEMKTGYKELIGEPMVIVTIDAGRFQYHLEMLPEPALIRTSGYEYVRD